MRTSGETSSQVVIRNRSSTWEVPAHFHDRRPVVRNATGFWSEITGRGKLGGAVRAELVAQPQVAGPVAEHEDRGSCR